MIKRIGWLYATSVGSAAVLAALVAGAGTAVADPAVRTDAARPSAQPAAGPLANSNWAGYIDVAKAGTKFRYVAASFKVPTVTCTSANSQASVWVGLDGSGAASKTVEQVGLSTNCKEGVPEYQGWYEMIPKPTVYTGYYAHPGDSISVSVYYDAGDQQYTMTFDDKTNASSSFTIPTKCPSGSTCDNGTAEAIVEAAGGTNVSKFSKINFTGAGVTSYTGTHGAFAASSLWTLSESHMADTSVSATSDSGSAFSVSYSG